MAKPAEDLKRVLHIKMRALGDPGQALSLIRSAAPFYRTHRRHRLSRAAECRRPRPDAD